MRQRRGFTLIEILVVMALTILILAILSEAFALGLAALRKAKATGDLQERLRGASTLIRRDLAADHFEGKRRLSDISWAEAPREGFFSCISGPASAAIVKEGACIDGIPSVRSMSLALHFAVKLRGNGPENFFAARVPPGSPLLGAQTTFFNQPLDARFQDQANTYNSQWAEVAYFLVENGSAAGTNKLYSLYRCQLTAVADNRAISWPPVVPAADLENYKDMSCRLDSASKNLYFNTSADLASSIKRSPPWNGVLVKALNPTNTTKEVYTLGADTSRATLLLNDVLNFNIEFLSNQDNYNANTFNWATSQFDTGSGTRGFRAIRITLRIWDVKSRQARQTSIVQDL